MNFLSRLKRKLSESNIKTISELNRELADFQRAGGVDEAEVMGLVELLEWQRKAGVRLIEIALLPSHRLTDPDAPICADWTRLREFFDQTEDLPEGTDPESMLAIAREVSDRKPRFRAPSGYQEFNVLM